MHPTVAQQFLVFCLYFNFSSITFIWELMSTGERSICNDIFETLRILLYFFSFKCCSVFLMICLMLFNIFCTIHPYPFIQKPVVVHYYVPVGDSCCLPFYVFLVFLHIWEMSCSLQVTNSFHCWFYAWRYTTGY